MRYMGIIWCFVWSPIFYLLMGDYRIPVIVVQVLGKYMSFVSRSSFSWG